MKWQELVALDDEALVSAIELLSAHGAAEAAADPGPAFEHRRLWLVLESRGRRAARKLLRLLSSPHPRVRLAGAKLCYNFAPARCRAVVIALEAHPEPATAQEAMLFLIDHDMGIRRLLAAEIARRHGSSPYTASRRSLAHRKL